MHFTINIDIFQLLFNYLEERPYNNICQNVKQDADYIEAAIQETEMSEQYKKLGLSEEQRKIIMQWIDAIQAQESAYYGYCVPHGYAVLFFPACAAG